MNHQVRQATNALYFTTNGTRESWHMVKDSHDRRVVDIHGDTDQLLKSIKADRKRLQDTHNVQIRAGKRDYGLRVSVSAK